jgi:protein O-mannosyl-transferase
VPSTAAKPKPVRPAAATPSLFSSPEKSALVLCLLLAVGTLALYNPVTRHGFINCDDDRYITENPYIQSGLNWTTVRWALTSTTQGGFWHPLTWMSHALDYQLFHLNPVGHHFMSLLIHALNVVLLFLLLGKATGRWMCSLLVAALFAVHPLNVESVSWAAERKNVLSTLFFLGAIGAYGWYSLTPNWKRYLAVAGLFVCGLASKPMVVTLPFVLLLLDYWPLGRIRGWSDSVLLKTEQKTPAALVIEKLPLIALSLAACAVTVIAQRAGGAVRSTGQFPLGVRLENAAAAYGTYLWKLAWPTRLAPLYPHPGASLPAWKVFLSALVLLGISAIVVRWRNKRYLVVGWLWFLGILVPTIGIIQVGYQAMADRFAYVPEIGIFVIVVWSAAALADQWKAGFSLRFVAGAIVLIALAAVTRVQLAYWTDSLSLWTHTLAVTQNNFVAEDNMGGALVLLGRAQEAYPHFQAAAEINPGDPLSHANLGAYLQEHGRLNEAIEQYRTVIQLTDDAALLGSTYANLGAVYRNLGDDQQAKENYDQALQANPNQFNSYLGLGLLLEKESKWDEAATAYSHSVALRPTAEGYLHLGRVLQLETKRDSAIAAYQEALRIDPNLTEAQKAVEMMSGQSRARACSVS